MLRVKLFLQILCFSSTKRARRLCFAFPLPLPVIGANLASSILQSLPVALAKVLLRATVFFS